MARRSVLVAALLALGLVAPGPVGAQLPPVTADGSRPDRATAGRVYDLEGAVATALRNHPGLATVAARTRAARTGVAATGARYRPFFEGHGALGKTLAGDHNLTFRDEVAVETSSIDPYYAAALGFVVPIVREGRLVFGRLPTEDVAQARHDVTLQGERLTRSEVVGAVTAGFFGALAAGAEVPVAERLVAMHRLLLEAARDRFDQQLVPRTEVLAAEAALAAAQANLAAATAARASSREAFVAALGIDLPAGEAQAVELVDPAEEALPVQPLEALLVDVPAQHPSMLAQAARLAEATATQRVLAAERYPTVDAQATLGALDDYSLPVDRWSFRSLLRLNWRLFDFGALDLRLKQQREIIRAEQLALAEVRRQVVASVTTAYHTLAGSQARVDAARRNAELMEERRRAMEERVRLDLAPPVDLVVAEVRVAEARKSLAQARYEARINQALLTRAMGRE